MFYVANEGHVVPILHPVDITGGADSDVFSMENYSHASIIISLGVTAAAPTFKVYECDNFTPSNATSIAFDVYKCETTLSDVLGAKVAATADAGCVCSTTNNIFYVVELDAAQLSEGYPCVQVRFTAASASIIAQAVVVLSGARYGSDQSATVIA